MGWLELLRTGKGPMDGWIARAYDRGVQAAFREIVPAVFEDLADQLVDAKQLLDVGCGPGQFTVLSAERLPQAEITGIDLAPTMIELARAHAAESPAHDRLHFEVADAAALPFPDAHFDAVLSTGSIKHWPGPVAGLREIYRVLRPGARAYIAEMNRLAPPDAVQEHRQRLRHWFFRFIYPYVFTKAMSPQEAHSVFAASPFGAPVEERMVFDGCVWMFVAQKAGA